MELKCVAVMAGLVLTFGCGTARASLVKSEFQGTIKTIYRQDGATFGTVEVGDRYRAVYVLNFKDDKPFSAFGLTESSVSNSLISISYNVDPVLFYEITINGKTSKTVVPSYANNVSYSQDSQNGGESDVFANVLIGPNTELYNEIDSPTSSISGNAFQTYTYKVGKADTVAGLYTNFFNTFALSPTQFSTSLYDASTVPLPASAPMFGAALLGLAGLGYAAKRKKAVEAI